MAVFSPNHLSALFTVIDNYTGTLFSFVLSPKASALSPFHCRDDKSVRSKKEHVSE